MIKPKAKFCGFSHSILTASNKPGKAGEIIKCNCGRMVKLRAAPNGSRSVQIPRHKKPEGLDDARIEAQCAEFDANNAYLNDPL